jgi:N-acetylmuramoyl-L-alanine amidase
VRLENHRLVGDNVRYDFDEGFKRMTPEIVVIHYAVTENVNATASALRASDYLSCHVTVDKYGAVIQQVPFNLVAYHAGKSKYQSRESCNGFAVGIEISNPGPLIKQPDGSLKTVYGRTWTGPAEEATHKSGLAPKSWTHWAGYSQSELGLCLEICGLLRDAYGIKDIVGHDDISPGRKFDPGPAFPIKWLRDSCLGLRG